VQLADYEFKQAERNVEQPADANANSQLATSQVIEIQSTQEIRQSQVTVCAITADIPSYQPKSLLIDDA